MSDCFVMLSVFVFRRLLINRSRACNPHFVDEEAELQEIVMC